MKTVETANLDDGLPVERLQRVLREHAVRLAILFGSHATETTHSTSDIDIAVEFESRQHDDPNYNTVFFELSEALSEILDTEEVDLVDIHTTSPDVASSLFEHGVLLVGEQTRVETLRRQLTTQSDHRTPRERFDTALRKIDEHLDSGSAVSATEGSHRER
ncbi:nucleotidyltransferase domain-containing protein [Halorussus gelatinilyticus]|uniref:Nucleotidyltransferase domain-containing protein n=1 Tax=Halorussus gelatinilyticus TaxID=2937524 RepID=A0A8U0IDF8_9EURY|nr:nucleotidyltransferase domain-containing protein [Halorussus gelatinilyticus]UPV98972.1 nucleotidyltransferase domain-containing protein [Halorussus gelatinilyticus]